MNRGTWGRIALGIVAVISQAITLQAAVAPGYVRVKVYEARVSRNTDCSGAVTVFRNASPTLVDFKNSPTLGSGAIPNGTYQCVMFRMSDNIHFTPASTDSGWSHGVCTPGADYTTDVGHDEVAVDPDGTAHTLAASGTEDIVWLYVRTGGHAGGGSAFTPTGGLPLTSPLVVNGDGVHTMNFNFGNSVDEGLDFSTWSCGCGAPSMSFL